MLNFKPLPVNILEAVKKMRTERVYASEAEEFLLSVISVSAGRPISVSRIEKC